MAFRDMNVEEMIGGTTALEQHREVLRNDVVLSPLAGLLFDHKRSLVEHQRALSAASVEAAELRTRSSTLDGRRDGCHRVVYGLLKLKEEASVSEQDKLKARQIAQQLYPDGLALVSFSYIAQSGRDERIEQLLTPELRAYLAELKLGDQDGAQLLQEAVTLGQELAALAVRRAELLKAAQEEESSASEGHRLRLRWVQLLNALEANAPMSQLGLSEFRRLFATIYSLSEAAGRRATARRAQNP